MLLAFDLDNCLVATREAQRLAYLEAGVVVPVGFEYLPRWQWPTGQPTNKHMAYRNAALPAMLEKHAHRLPAYALLRPGDYVLTGSSRESVGCIMRLFPELRQAVVHAGLSADDKIWWLNKMGTGIYFDDWSVMIEKVKGETKWQTIDTSKF